VVETPLELGTIEGAASRYESTVVEKDLTICLRYEPPSPKFRHQCPYFASYRLKVSRGSEFLYSTRGMEAQLNFNKASLSVVWGNLELAFLETSDLGAFISTLKYVDIAESTLPAKLVTLPSSKLEESEEELIMPSTPLPVESVHIAQEAVYVIEGSIHNAPRATHKKSPRIWAVNLQEAWATSSVSWQTAVVVAAGACIVVAYFTLPRLRTRSR